MCIDRVLNKYQYYICYQYYISTISISVLYQYYTSTISVLYQYYTSTIPVLYQYYISTIPVLYQYYTSTISVLYQYYISTIPVLYNTLQCTHLFQLSKETIQRLWNISKSIDEMISGNRLPSQLSMNIRMRNTDQRLNDIQFPFIVSLFEESKSLFC